MGKRNGRKWDRGRVKEIKIAQKAKEIHGKNAPFSPSTKYLKRIYTQLVKPGPEVGCQYNWPFSVQFSLL